jgi:titin
VNYITATQQIYPLPDGTTYVSATAAGPGTYTGGPASNPSGSFPLAVNYCTAPSDSCTATTAPTATFLGATTGPYIEIGLGSAQIPAGATLNLPEVTVTLQGTSTETVNWTESEFQTTANINLLGNNISIPVKGYPTAATTVPSAGPAPALLDPPPTLASVTVTASAHPNVPGAPTENSVTAGDANVTVVWTPPASNGGSPITGYVITPSSGSPVTVGNVTKYTVTGLTNGTPYTFTVAATNAAGTGPPSNALPAATPVGVSSTAAVAPLKTIAFTGANLDKAVKLGVALVLLGGLLLLTRRLFGRRRRTT